MNQHFENCEFDNSQRPVPLPPHQRKLSEGYVDHLLRGLREELLKQEGLRPNRFSVELTQRWYPGCHGRKIFLDVFPVEPEHPGIWLPWVLLLAAAACFGFSALVYWFFMR